MRLLLGILLLFTSSGFAYEVNPEDYVKSPLEELQDIATQMESMASKLREDRHDTAVEIQGKEIDDRLNKLIKLVEDNTKQVKTSKPSSSPPDRLKQAFSQGSPRQLSQPHPDWVKIEEPKKDKPKRNDWAKLPPAERDQLLQVWAEEVPVRWKKRIEAYFLSVIASETPPDDRKAEIVRIPQDGDR